MKALSLWQPWASLWCSDAKEHETRDWELHHRGWLLVHAAKTREGFDDVDGHLDGIISDRFGSNWRLDLPRGMIIGAVDVIDVQATSVILKHYGKMAGMVDSKEWTDLQCGNFGPRRYGFLRREFKRFAQPIPYRGQQGPFNVPDEIVRAAFDAAPARAEAA
jgi:hypothetical protein